MKQVLWQTIIRARSEEINHPNWRISRDPEDREAIDIICDHAFHVIKIMEMIFGLPICDRRTLGNLIT